MVMMHLAVSPMPKVRTPGHLSRAIRREVGIISWDQHRMCKFSWQSWLVSFRGHSRGGVIRGPSPPPPNEEHCRLHLCASMSEGPADPVTFRAAEQIALASVASKMTGCASAAMAEGSTASGVVLCALTFPANINLANARARPLEEVFDLVGGSLFCIALPSTNSSSIFLCFNTFTLC